MARKQIKSFSDTAEHELKSRSWSASTRAACQAQENENMQLNYSRQLRSPPNVSAQREVVSYIYFFSRGVKETSQHDRTVAIIAGWDVIKERGTISDDGRHHQPNETK